jgi:DNA-binding GntR family transcriptional regulator
MHNAGDEDGFFQADEGMHAQIIAIAGHANAWRTVENAKAQLDRVRYLNLRTTKKQQLVLAEHGEIIERLIARDAPGAVAAMRVHLRGLFRSVEILRSENAGYFNEDTNLASPPSRTKGVAAQAAGIQPMTDGGQQQT